MTKVGGGSITLTNNGTGIYETGAQGIGTAGEEFIYEIAETAAPNGYIGLGSSFRIKVTTKLNTAGTAYELDSVKFVNNSGTEISEVAGVTIGKDEQILSGLHKNK